MYNSTNMNPFRFWCQKVIPLVYDNSLSYYEVLCKTVDYLNKMLADLQELLPQVESNTARLDAIQLDFDSLKAMVNALNTRVTNAEDEIAVLGCKVNNAVELVNSLNETVATLAALVNTFDGRITTNETDIANIKANVTAIQQSIASINTTLVEHGENIEHNTSGIEALQELTGTHQTAIDTNRTAIASLNNAVAALNGTLANIQATVARNETEIEAIETRVEAVEGVANANNTKIGVLDALTTTAKSNLVDAINEVAAGGGGGGSDWQESRVQQIESNVSTLRSDVDELQSTTQTNTSNIETLTENVSDLQTELGTTEQRLTSAEDSITAHATEIGALQTGIGTLQTSVSNNTNNIGDLSALQTTETDSLVSAINSLASGASLNIRVYTTQCSDSSIELTNYLPSNHLCGVTMFLPNSPDLQQFLIAPFYVAQEYSTTSGSRAIWGYEYGRNSGPAILAQRGRGLYFDYPFGSAQTAKVIVTDFGEINVH